MGRKKRPLHNHAEEDWDDSVMSNSKLGKIASISGNIKDNDTISTSSSYLQKGKHEYAISGKEGMDDSIVDKSLAIFIVSNNIALDVVEAPSFVDFVKGVAQYGPKYKLPTSLMLQTNSFPEVEMEVEKYVKNVKQSWAVKGCSIMLGKWKNFISITAYSPQGAVFLKLHKIPNYMDPEFIVKDIVSSAIENVGTDHVVQMITNSDMIYNIIENVLLDKHSQIYRIRCAAHEIHFLLKAIYDEVGWVQTAIDNGALVVKCLYEDVNILSLMRQLTKSGELKHPCKSKFASNYQMLQSILRNKKELQKLVALDKWKALTCNKRAAEISNIIQSGNFWNQVQEVLNVMDPLIQVLRLVEDDRPTLGYLYEAMEKAKEEIKRYYNNDHTKDSKVLELFEKWRSNKIMHPIHAVAALLNPAYMCRSDFKFNADMSRGIEFMLENLVSNGEKDKFIEEMKTYRAKISMLFNTMAQQLMKVSHPRLWWDYSGVYLPVLKKYAIRILSQTCKCSCDLKPSAFEVAQIKMINEAKTASQENYLYTSMNAKNMENFRSLDEQYLLPMDLGNCNELPDYVDPKLSWCDDQLDLNCEKSDRDANKAAGMFSLDGKSKYTPSTSLHTRKRWRKTFIVICTSIYWTLLPFYSGHCQSSLAGGDRYRSFVGEGNVYHQFSGKLCRPLIMDDSDFINKAQRRWKKILNAMRFLIYLFRSKKEVAVWII